LKAFDFNSNGISILNTSALNLAVDLINSKCSGIFISNLITVGGLLGKDQNNFPSSVL
jgi:hypothetical protein